MAMLRSCHVRALFRKCSGVRLPATFWRWDGYVEVLSFQQMLWRAAPPPHFGDGMAMLRSCHARAVFRKCSGVRLPRWDGYVEVLSWKSCLQKMLWRAAPPPHFGDGMAMLRSCHARAVFKKCSGVRLPRWDGYVEVLSCKSRLQKMLWRAAPPMGWLC